MTLHCNALGIRCHKMLKAQKLFERIILQQIKYTELLKGLE